MSVNYFEPWRRRKQTKWSRWVLMNSSKSIIRPCLSAISYSNKYTKDQHNHRYTSGIINKILILRNYRAASLIFSRLSGHLRTLLWEWILVNGMECTFNHKTHILFRNKLSNDCWKFRHPNNKTIDHVINNRKGENTQT